ncbi:MAG TPA: class I SAM-dependent methyltransferase [Steroidobacteraceae bacterium]|nr:class I SAM-dependent methyltransferase [Steroidobacteraceae bacterium]
MSGPESANKVAGARAACRFCGAPLSVTFVDLGMSPLCQTHIEPHELNHMERFYPLHAWVCEACFLVQLEEYVSPEQIFSDYAYFSSYADSWVEHARRYTESMIARLGLGARSLVMEIASNDGYLLQHFVARGVPCRGIEPAANVAEVAIRKGIPTTVKFLGKQTAAEIVAEFGNADLVLGNNVLAHVPDINDFVGGMRILLKQGGVITMEFPHLLKLMDENQFDTIYHEHFSYLSFGTVERVFAHHGLRLFDVDQIPTHGGSLRIYGCHAADSSHPNTPAVEQLRAHEIARGLQKVATYGEFEARVKDTKRKLLRFLIDARAQGKSVVGYGAPGKGNTLLNYCGIRTDFLDYTVDRSPHKQGRYTPGTHIPILAPERIRETRPDYILILPWNLKNEIVKQHDYVRSWGGRFVVPIPEVRVLD